MNDEGAQSTANRRALEALRAGVPNRDAVRVMGCEQVHVEKRFAERLAALPEDFARGHQTPGLLVSGGFGAGKSHLLAFLEDRALAGGFVCSRIVISKETPLYNPDRVYRAAIDAAIVPGVTGQAIQEISHQLDKSSEAYARFAGWCNRESRLSRLFPATLMLHERIHNDPELIEQIVNFWSGERLSIPPLRRALKQLDASSQYELKSVAMRQLAVQRFLFAARLMVAAGYKGWVLLVDEIELIGRYGFLQRARSYAEIARWMGLVRGEQFPGLIMVGAITDDFDAAVIEGKGDREVMAEKLRAKMTEEYDIVSERARIGIETIGRKAIALMPPDEQSLKQTYEALKRLHGDAYGWQPPELDTGPRTLTRQMRSYVRRWINEWDLKRLFPGIEVATVEEELRPNYTEDLAIEQPPKPEDP
jgi:BREX system ATP-binding protein BrxC/D